MSVSYTLKASAVWLGGIITVLIFCPAVYAAGLGSEAPAIINIVEEHSEVLCHWYQAGKRGITAINVDAHNDFFSPGRTFDHDIPKIRKIFAEKECADVLPLFDSSVHKGDLFNIGDYLQVAYKLGVIKDLWWVIPTKNRLPLVEFEQFKAWFQGKWAIPQTFIDTLSYDGKTMRGHYHGMPVNMVILDDLPIFSEEVLLTVDVDYFPELQQHLADPSMLQLLNWFFTTLGQKNINSPMVEISTSVPRYYTPLRFKYIAQRVKEWLEQPENSSARLSTSLVQEAFETALRETDYSAALTHAYRLAGLQPESPLPYYDMSLVHMANNDIGSALRTLDAAVAKDLSYQHGYLSLSRALYARGLKDESFQVLSRGHRSHPDNIILMDQVGRYHLERKEYASAEAIYRKLLKKDPTYLLGEQGLGQALFYLGRKDQAKDYYASVIANLPPGQLQTLLSEEWEALSLDDNNGQAVEQTFESKALAPQ